MRRYCAACGKKHYREEKSFCTLRCASEYAEDCIGVGDSHPFCPTRGEEINSGECDNCDALPCEGCGEMVPPNVDHYC